MKTPASIPSLHAIAQTFRRDITLKSWRAKWRAQSAPLEFVGAQKELFDYLLSLVREREAARKKAIAKLRTREDILSRAAWARAQLLELTGLQRLPSRTPLNPRVTPGFELDGCRVEHVVFESRPGLFVTANLYLPESLGRGEKIPAVLHCCGHAAIGKAHQYQMTCAGLALRGIAVLIFDPAGQGERDEYADRATGKRTVLRACRAHGVAGDPMYLTGSSFGAFRLWDAMRAVDYLQSRPEIDPRRIGATGPSGGAWESLWLAAIDPRIQAVNSNCYVTTLRRRIENRAADAEPDPEQDPFGMIERGLDIGDVILACLPRAVSLGMTTFDFFPIDGALRCYQEARGLFRRAGCAKHIGIQVSDAGHEMTPEMRRQCYAWMIRWLRPAPERRNSRQVLATADGAVHHEWIVSERQTFCSRSGVVLKSLGGKTSAQIQAEFARETMLKRRLPKSPAERAAFVRSTLARLLRFQRVSTPLDVRADEPQTIGAARATIRRVSIATERGLTLTGHLWEPIERDGAKPNPPAPFPKREGGDWGERRRRAVVYVSEKSNDYEPAKNAVCGKYAREGAVVLDLDPRGMGPRKEVWLDFVPLIEADLNYDALLLGRPLLGMRVADVLRGVDLLLDRGDVDPRAIHVYGEGYGALLALFAACIDDRIAGVTEHRGLKSYASLVFNREYAWPVNAILPEILKYFDLDDVRAAIAPRISIVSAPCDHLGRAANS